MIAATLLLTASSLITGPLVAGPTPPAPWRPPVTPLVIERPFVSPSGPYSAGHRGVDLLAAPGSTVRAPAAGIVRVAGRVAGKAVVSVEHPHVILGRTGWRTTYEGVAATVSVGDRVRGGDSLGRVITHPHAHGIHWGLKNGRAYADPLLLLRRPVVLKPVSRH